MQILELPLFLFKEYYWNILTKAHKDIYPLEPESKKEYLQYFDDSIVTFIVKERVVVGFIVWVVCKEPRTNELFGTSLWLWVNKNYRNTIAAGKLIKEVENRAKEEGCSHFKWDINKDSALVKAFDKRREYQRESIVYCKKLYVESLN